MITPREFRSELLRVASPLMHVQRDMWGFETYDLANLPRRLLDFSDPEAHSPSVVTGLDPNRLKPQPTPSESLCGDAASGWAAMSNRSIARVTAMFLVAEDPQRRLDARPVETLAHQVSLVRHILDQPSLRRVLIADEVGLGKTVEVAMLLQELLAERPQLRVLYLAPARLVTNVRREFDLMQLRFRQWTALEADARLDDSRVIASMHRAVHGENLKRVTTTAPWDVIVVDECHHLSAWSPNGGDPTGAFRLVRDLIKRQPSDGRLILLSGTPHQGSRERFNNLLGLLRAGDEPSSALAGRVIYRTKEDVHDWDGRKLFPPREVRDPMVIDLGPEHKEWLARIHDYFHPRAAGQSESQARAMNWRCALALQWAASSPQAGVGYLVRHAIRKGWSFDRPAVHGALRSLRPYRGGSADEPVATLFARMQREVARQASASDVADIEEGDSEDFDSTVAAAELDELLVAGCELINRLGDNKWNLVWEMVLSKVDGEKVVLFAQPIETVCALAGFLQRRTGIAPAMIVGGQSDEERTTEIDQFRLPNGPQFLVSSRAGGEGLNLQVARHLVHLDVPWNPMELEQRVGRVHRFGSRFPIIVNTIVAKHSREADAYRVARQKLHLIAKTMTDPSRFEMVFSRVMCLMPPEDLQGLFLGHPATPFSTSEEEHIANLVQDGFNAWSDFHHRYGSEQDAIRAQSAGSATWEDLAAFAIDHCSATAHGDHRTHSFGHSEGTSQEARALKFSSGSTFALGDYRGSPVFGPNGKVVPSLGLNRPEIAKKLLELASPEENCGAAHLRRGKEFQFLNCDGDFGVVVFLRQSYQIDPKRNWRESKVTLHAALVPANEPVTELDCDARAKFIRALRGASPRRGAPSDTALLARIQETERSMALALWRPDPDAARLGLRHAVTPLLAAYVSA